MAVVGNRITRKSAGSRYSSANKGTAIGDDIAIEKAQEQLAAAKATKNKLNSKGVTGNNKIYNSKISKLESKIRDLRGVKKLDPKTVKVGKMTTPNRMLAKDESKVSQSNMMKSKAPVSANPEVKKRKARRNAAGTMGQMASGGKVKKMMGGGMAMKYKHGGKVGKKCPRDGIAMKGKTKA